MDSVLGSLDLDRKLLQILVVLDIVINSLLDHPCGFLAVLLNPLLIVLVFGLRSLLLSASISSPLPQRC
jgi:hypothetical protein